VTVSNIVDDQDRKRGEGVNGSYSASAVAPRLIVGARLIVGGPDEAFKRPGIEETVAIIS